MLIADVRVETRNLFVPFKCENLFLHGVQIFIHTYIFIPLIQSLHQLHLNVEHVDIHQTTQDIKKIYSQDKTVKQTEETQKQ